MNLDVQARGFNLTPALQDAVRSELRTLALQDGAHWLQVRLFDVNGGRGGIDKRCLVTLHLNGEKRAIVATGLDADMYRAIPEAFEKLRRAIGQSADRVRSMRRRPSPPTPET